MQPSARQALYAEAEIPGVKAEDLEVYAVGNELTIRGEKKQEQEQQGRNYHYTEWRFGSFLQSIQLPVSVDAEQVEAVFKNGTLTVTLAKHSEARARRIAIKEG